MERVGLKSDFRCRICLTPTQDQILRIERDRTYTVVACSQCGALQTVETCEAVSPDYVGLGTGDIDAGRIWCQGSHKLPAFRV
jgi:hypothetical protein